MQRTVDRVGDAAYLRLTAIGLTIGALVMTVHTVVAEWVKVLAFLGADYWFFVGIAARWLDSGQFYQPHQLAGPYVATTAVDTLYPPATLALFLPFVWLPAILWWLIPVGILVWHVAQARPAWWSWPLLAFCLWWPRTYSIVVFGNTGMWIAAFVALGLRFGWPGALVLLKPSFAPFALAGIRSRGWWLAAAVMAVVSLPMLPDYIAAIRNNVGPWPGLLHGFQDFPFIAIPVIAWWARARSTGPDRTGPSPHHREVAADPLSASESPPPVLAG